MNQVTRIYLAVVARLCVLFAIACHLVGGW
jgi:hypothetical protein